MKKQNSSSRMSSKENKPRQAKAKITELSRKAAEPSNNVSPGPIDLQIVQGQAFSPLDN